MLNESFILNAMAKSMEIPLKILPSKVVFVVASDDPAWVTQHVKHKVEDYFNDKLTQSKFRILLKIWCPIFSRTGTSDTPPRTIGVWVPFVWIPFTLTSRSWPIAMPLSLTTEHLASGRPIWRAGRAIWPGVSGKPFRPWSKASSWPDWIRRNITSSTWTNLHI